MTLGLARIADPEGVSGTVDKRGGREVPWFSKKKATEQNVPEQKAAEQRPAEGRNSVPLPDPGLPASDPQVNEADDNANLIPLQQLLHQYFVDVGFELLEGGAIYRGSIPSPVLDGKHHNVFVSLSDIDPAIMSPFGEASQISQAELDVVRTPDDGYKVITIASHAAFHHSFSREEVLRDPSQIVDSAIRLGNYAATVESAIMKNQQEKTEILARLQHLIDSNNWGIVSSGQVSAEAVIADAERALALVPDEDLWQIITGAANRAAVWTWASGSPNETLSSSPWSRIADRLTEYGEERGWKLT